jgi:cell division protease FtsH
MSSKARVAVFWTILICVAGALWMVVAGRHAEPKVSYSQFLTSVESGRIASVTIAGNNLGAIPAVCRLKDGSTVRTVLPSDYRDALRAMQDKLVNVEIRDSELPRILLNSAPFLILLGFWFLMYRKLRNGPRQGLSG